MISIMVQTYYLSNRQVSIVTILQITQLRKFYAILLLNVYLMILSSSIVIDLTVQGFIFIAIRSFNLNYHEKIPIVVRS